LLQSVYRDFGFKEVTVKFSDRPPTRAGSDAVWDKAEAALKHAVEAAGLPYTLNPGEGAFYGPKLEFVLRDALGRDWQCGTLQVDFVLPERLDAHYIGEDGQRHRPVMLHRAILGSLERFIGILIEHFAGAFPFWLAPVQVRILPVGLGHHEAAHALAARLSAYRVEVDDSDETVGKRIRNAEVAKIPFTIVYGDKESDDALAVREHGGGQFTKSLSELLEQLGTLEA